MNWRMKAKESSPTIRGSGIPMKNRDGTFYDPASHGFSSGKVVQPKPFQPGKAPLVSGSTPPAANLNLKKGGFGHASWSKGKGIAGFRRDQDNAQRYMGPDHNPNAWATSDNPSFPGRHLGQSADMDRRDLPTKGTSTDIQRIHTRPSDVAKGRAQEKAKEETRLAKLKALGAPGKAQIGKMERPKQWYDIPSSISEQIVDLNVGGAKMIAGAGRGIRDYFSEYGKMRSAYTPSETTLGSVVDMMKPGHVPKRTSPGLLKSLLGGSAEMLGLDKAVDEYAYAGRKALKGQLAGPDGEANNALYHWLSRETPQKIGLDTAEAALTFAPGLGPAKAVGSVVAKGLTEGAKKGIRSIPAAMGRANAEQMAKGLLKPSRGLLGRGGTAATSKTGYLANKAGLSKKELASVVRGRASPAAMKRLTSTVQGASKEELKGMYAAVSKNLHKDEIARYAAHDMGATGYAPETHARRLNALNEGKPLNVAREMARPVIGNTLVDGLPLRRILKGDTAPISEAGVDILSHLAPPALALGMGRREFKNAIKRVTKTRNPSRKSYQDLMTSFAGDQSVGGKGALLSTALGGGSAYSSQAAPEMSGTSGLPVDVRRKLVSQAKGGQVFGSNPSALNELFGISGPNVSDELSEARQSGRGQWPTKQDAGLPGMETERHLGPGILREPTNVERDPDKDPRLAYPNEVSRDNADRGLRNTKSRQEAFNRMRVREGLDPIDFNPKKSKKSKEPEERSPYTRGKGIPMKHIDDQSKVWPPKDKQKLAGIKDWITKRFKKTPATPSPYRARRIPLPIPGGGGTAAPKKSVYRHLMDRKKGLLTTGLVGAAAVQGGDHYISGDAEKEEAKQQGQSARPQRASPISQLEAQAGEEIRQEKALRSTPTAKAPPAKAAPAKAAPPVAAPAAPTSGPSSAVKGKKGHTSYGWGSVGSQAGGNSSGNTLTSAAKSDTSPAKAPPAGPASAQKAFSLPGGKGYYHIAKGLGLKPSKSNIQAIRKFHGTNVTKQPGRKGTLYQGDQFSLSKPGDVASLNATYKAARWKKKVPPTKAPSTASSSGTARKLFDVAPTTSASLALPPAVSRRMTKAGSKPLPPAFKDWKNKARMGLK